MRLRRPCMRSEPQSYYIQRSEHDDEQAIKLPELYPKKTKIFLCASTL